MIEAAILVFAERGLNGTVIEHVVRRAGVSRGTFYNYFDTVEEALEAARVALGRELVLLVKGAVDVTLSPAERLSHGLHAFIEIARRNTLFLEFSARLERRSYSFAAVLCDAGPGFIADGIKTGAFRPIPESLVFDLLEVGTIAVLRRIMAGEEVDVDAFVAAMLRVLGLGYEASIEMARRTGPVAVPPIPEDSLLGRGNMAWAQSQ